MQLLHRKDDHFDREKLDGNLSAASLRQVNPGFFVFFCHRPLKTLGKLL
jgi:hypothetical protein